MNRRTLGAIPLLLLAGPAAAAEADSVAAVKSRGKLVDGVKLDTPPFGFLDDSNAPAGFDLNLMRAVPPGSACPSSSRR